MTPVDTCHCGCSGDSKTTVLLACTVFSNVQQLANDFALPMARKRLDTTFCFMEFHAHPNAVQGCTRGRARLSIPDQEKPFGSKK